MKRPTIFEATPFLQDPVRYREFLVRGVASSCAIETGESVDAIARRLRKFFDEGTPPIRAPRARSSP
jgi:hypothetical protein